MGQALSLLAILLLPFGIGVSVGIWMAQNGFIKGRNNNDR